MEMAEQPKSVLPNQPVPLFLLKLLSLLQEPAYHEYVSWSEDGTSFTVHDQANFSKVVLPKYFKHNKFASFVRQLNMYGFRKLTTLVQGSLSDQHEAIEFHHPYFIRDNQDLLLYIKRKVSHSHKQTDDFNVVLDEVNHIKDSQQDISNSLMDLKRENEDLWREVVSLRQKHSQQQKVVNHLIKFLVSLVQHHGMGGKRRLPLMIDNEPSTSPSPTKTPRSSVASQFNHEGSSGSVVHDVDGGSQKDGPQITEVFSTSATPSAGSNSAESKGLNRSDSFDISQFIQLNDTNDQRNQDAFVATPKQTQPENSGSVETDIIEPSVFLNIPSTISDPTNSVASSMSNPLQLATIQRSVPAITAGIRQKPLYSLADIPSTRIRHDSTVTEDLNYDMDKIQNNLETIKERLSNNDQIQFNPELFHDLFNTTPYDIMSTPNIYDSAIPLPLPTSQAAGNELVKYNSANNIFDDNSKDDAVDWSELSDILKE